MAESPAERQMREDNEADVRSFNSAPSPDIAGLVGRLGALASEIDGPRGLLVEDARECEILREAAAALTRIGGERDEALEALEALEEKK